MQITNLKLYNFRNYDHLNLDFSKKLNIIIGENGSGKTNLVEAIYILGITKSFRSNHDKYYIKHGTNHCEIEGNIYDKRNDKYKITLVDEKKIIKINNIEQKKFSNYISKINIISFTPDDLKIIKDTPMFRRRMINIEISQLNKNYVDVLNDYNKLLKQRNSYLRSMSLNGYKDSNYLDIITKKLIDCGKKIYEMRNNYFININNIITSIYKKITKLDGLNIKYISEYGVNEDQLLKNYKNNLNRDLILGKTTIGVHHDDIKFLLNKKNLKDYGSQGQQKNAIISLKLAEIELFKNSKNSIPILILDDLFSEIDSKKSKNIINLLKKRNQVFITATDIKSFDEKILNECKIFKINKNQKITEEIK